MVNKTFGLVFVLLQSLAYNLKTTFAGGYMFVVSMCRFDFRWHRGPHPQVHSTFYTTVRTFCTAGK